MLKKLFLLLSLSTMLPFGKAWLGCYAQNPTAGSFESTIQPILPIPDEVRKPNAKQGRIEEFKYMAHKNGRTFQKHARVYTPYGYKAEDKKTKYDVLYLMHGGRD